jgi:hypothetical protein
MLSGVSTNAQHTIKEELPDVSGFFPDEASALHVQVEAAHAAAVGEKY